MGGHLIKVLIYVPKGFSFTKEHIRKFSSLADVSIAK